ncbi:hypothetical protein [Geothrix sp.]|jgi:hypothetical protein|uniref:hypothetical protein n=1 Tax=Geothrix sp. TaxID=1962974 RepID=UPI0025C0DA65|nr:hypothetical protein [Geothrix sp.]
MPLYRASLRALGAVALLAVALACGGKKKEDAASANSVNIAGTVTYVRVPLANDANGVPTGLVDSSVAANLQTKPARGVLIRVYQLNDQLGPDGVTKTPVWLLKSSGFTDANGLYLLAVPKDKPLMVELMSTFDGGGGHSVNLIGDPAGIASTVPQSDRYRYAMRKAFDGTAPAGNPTPASLPAGDGIVNFTVGLSDKWWLVNPTYDRGSLVATAAASPVDETTLAGRTTGTGSRVLAIGDTVASFKGVYGTATPGATLDLHYVPGVSSTRGSFIEYDRTVYPLAFDAYLSSLHYFGSIQGGPANDDAFDEGVILPLLARNLLWAGNNARTFSTPLAPLFPVAAALTDLSPDMARIEGLAEAMAANVLKTPYLADTQGTALAAPAVDIRNITGLSAAQLSPYSAPAIRALAWEIILKASSVASPGNPTTWTNSINPLAAARFFQAPVGFTNGATDATGRDTEPLNIYSQLARLKESKNLGEPADLVTIFTDATLTSLTTPFGVPWPRPTTGATAVFVSSWGTDPNALTTPLAPFTLSMAKAVQVRGSYPNASEGEVFYSGFSLSADKRYILSVAVSPALDATSQIDLDLPQLSRTFSFTGAGGSTAALTLPVANTAPFYHPVRVRLKSPTAIQPDVSVTVSFTPSL